MKVLTRKERDVLILAMDQMTMDMYGPGNEKRSTKYLQSLKKKRDRLMHRYLTGLPILNIGRCPFCGKIATKSVDTFGLDSPWWDLFGKDLPPKACPHFLVMLGALNLHGQIPEEAAPELIDEIYPGPEVPFLVPRLMNLSGMQCILFSTRIIQDKYTVFFMTYFADPPAPPEQGHQPWLRNQFTYTDAKGNFFWNTRNDVWDFEIKNWLSCQPPRVGWIRPDDSEMKIVRSPLSACPYLNVQGRRKPLSIQQGKVYELPLPDGKPFDADIFE